MTRTHVVLEQHLDAATGGDKQRAGYLARLAGYAEARPISLAFNDISKLSEARRTIVHGQSGRA